MNSKLREALTKVSDILETWCDHLPPIIQDEAEEALALADEALSAPPRNCDRFANETAAQIAFLKEVCFINVTGIDYDTFDCWTNLMKHRYVKWLLAEAEGGTT